MCRRLIALIIVLAGAVCLEGCDSTTSEIDSAARSGDLQTVKSLLRAHPDLVSSRDDTGSTPLHYAAQYGHRDVVESLLDSGADVYATDRMGVTPVHLAAACGYKDIWDLMLQRVNVKGDVKGLVAQAQ